MIDIENEIITLIYNAVQPSYPTAKFESVLNLSPSSFPCICVEELDNLNRTSTSDSGSNERHANVTYEINILTNDVSGKKAAAKNIRELIDNTMLAHGFDRITNIPSGLDNGTKYRILVRYEATVSQNHTIYRR
jgi:hypothetical protein